MTKVAGSPERGNDEDVVLVVDDSEAARYSLARLLRNAGFRTQEAASGEAALALVEGNSIELIVLDVSMPGISGFEVVQRLRANPKSAFIPILHVSATYRDSDSVVTGLEGGADGYLTQPIDPAVFIATCRALVRMGRAERARVQAERQRAEMAELLNREINHRVKNNLLLVSALFQMHMERAAPGSELEHALRDASARVMALSTVHEQMSHTEPDEVDLAAALRRVVDLVQNVLTVQRLKCDLSLSPLKASASGAASVVLLANELLTNALKHGAPGESGELELTIELVEREPDRVILSVWNSGNPIPEGFRVTPQQGLGLQIASIMATQQLVAVSIMATQQLGGRLLLRPKNGGTLAKAILDRKRLLPTEAHE